MSRAHGALPRKRGRPITAQPDPQAVGELKPGRTWGQVQRRLKYQTGRVFTIGAIRRAHKRGLVLP